MSRLHVIRCTFIFCSQGEQRRLGGAGGVRWEDDFFPYCTGVHGGPAFSGAR